MVFPNDVEPVGAAGTTEKHDIRIEIDLIATGDCSDTEGDNEIHLSSPVFSLFGPQQRDVISEVLNEAGIRGATVQATDNHALDFVIQARVRAAIAQLSSNDREAERR